VDKRWEKLGDLLVNYSMNVKAGEKVMIAMTEIESFPLVYAIYKFATKAGAFVQVQFLSEELNHLVMKFGNNEQLSWVPEIEAYGMDWADVYFGLRGAIRLNIHSDIAAETLASFRKGMGKISTLRWEKTRWCLLRLPNSSLAVEAGVNKKIITDMFFNSCLLDWKEVSKKWIGWANALKKGKNIRLIGNETDLSFSIENRNWFVSDGRINMPDGEIATAPICDTIDGFIYFEFPGVMGGRLINDVRLAWDKGKLVSATSSTNQDFLQLIINTDSGANRIGEFAFGTNPFVNLFCKDILIDEKIGGTVHIALGRSYPNCGGDNQSAIHWDIIKDTRQNGKIYLDNKLIFENGKMLI
jgi:aminopeptidase